VIILEDSNPNEYYRWRYWEEISAARAAASPITRQKHLDRAGTYRRQLLPVGEILPLPSDAMAADGRAEIQSSPTGED